MGEEVGGDSVDDQEATRVVAKCQNNQRHADRGQIADIIQILPVISEGTTQVEEKSK
jgi:hypothetical protein